MLRGENDDTNLVQRPTKPHRVIADGIRKQSVRQCRRCHRAECPGYCDILKCPCDAWRHVRAAIAQCRDVDSGKKCTWEGGQ